MSTYKIMGRYIKNNKLDGYYLVDNTGKSIKASVKYVIRLTKKGSVENAKVQTSKNGYELLRGIGINLTRLREVEEDSRVLSVGVDKILGIIKLRDKVIGYRVWANGKPFNISIQKCKEMAKQCRFSNAELTDNETVSEIKIDSVEELKNFLMDSRNRIFDVESKDLLVRALEILQGCVVNEQDIARKGDYVVVEHTGKIKVMQQKEFNSKYKIVDNEDCTLCETQLRGTDFKVSLKTFSEQTEVYGADSLSSWLICKPSN